MDAYTLWRDRFSASVVVAATQHGPDKQKEPFKPLKHRNTHMPTHTPDTLIYNGHPTSSEKDYLLGSKLKISPLLKDGEERKG